MVFDRKNYYLLYHVEMLEEVFLTVSPPEAEADTFRYECKLIISTEYIGIVCWWEFHDH